MTAFDAALLVIAVLVAAGGWAAGLLAALSTLAGFAVGAVGGRFVAPHLGAAAENSGVLSSQAAQNLELALPVVLGFVLASVGGWVGTAMRESIRGRVGRGFDALGGAIGFAVAFSLVVWLGAGLARNSSLVNVNEAVAESEVIGVLDRAMPLTSGEALGAVAEALAASGFPQVFSGQEEQIRAVGEPDPGMVDVGRAAEKSTVRVMTTAGQCSAQQAGSGWVLDEGLIVTNAHVVAGSSERVVQVAGRGAPYRADVVLFDDRSDIAVLRAPGLSAEPLPLGEPLGPGDDSVVVGFPDNGPFTISPTRVREQLQARGLDIYDEETVVRSVYSVRGVVRPGNSGGPLLDSQGRVAGLVFARSAEDEETGYALTLDEMRGALDDGREQARTGGEGDLVPAGSCAAG